jgi:signal peptidase I
MSDNPFIHETQGPRNNIFKEIFEALVIAVTINVVIYFLFIIPSQVEGPSMLPNLKDKELLFANKTPTWFSSNADILSQLNWDYQRGDIIIFDHENIVLVKRIVAAEGDEIFFTDGDVYVNGKKMYETYLPIDAKTYLPQEGLRSLAEGERLVIPDGHFFVLGDNRSMSKDSRYIDVGIISREKIKGVVFFRFWPMESFGPIGRGDFKEQADDQ